MAEQINTRNPNRGEVAEADVAAIAARLTNFQREQILGIHENQKWSSTHGWESARDQLQCLGLIVRTNTDRWLPTTDPTPLGLAVRATLSRPSLAGASAS